MKLILLVVTLVVVGGRAETEIDLGEENIKVWGDLVTIVKKSTTDTARAEDFFTSHVLRVALPSSSIDLDLDEFLPRSLDVEGRGRLKKMLLPILLALKIKAAIIVPIAMSFIALIAVKGMLSGFASLLLSKGLALKAMLQQSHHGHGHGHFEHHDHHRVNYEERPSHWHRDDKERPYVVYVPTANRNKPNSRFEEVPSTPEWKPQAGWAQETQTMETWSSEDPLWVKSLSRPQN